jgi:poly(3-hydroxybutyrate) depolymerase
MKKSFLFIAALCCAVMASAAQYNALKTIQSGGVSRQYFLYVPDNLKPNSPMFISCHGMDQDYQYQKTQMKWMPSSADTASFVVVFPVGVAGTIWGQPYTTGWNINDMTDVNFMLDIIDEVKTDYNIDDTRVYMSGFSLGGVFAYYMAQKAPDRIAAVVSFSGYDITDASISCSRPIPVFHLHGTSDIVMPYQRAEAYVKKWYNLFHCKTNDVIQHFSLPYDNNATLTTYTNCDCEVEVKLLKVPSVGHDWTIINYGTTEVEAILAFCKQYNTGCGKIHVGLDDITTEHSATKRLEDGQLLIDRDGKTFTATGIEVK